MTQGILGRGPWCPIFNASLCPMKVRGTVDNLPISAIMWVLNVAERASHVVHVCMSAVGTWKRQQHRSSGCGTTDATKNDLDLAELHLGSHVIWSGGSCILYCITVLRRCLTLSVGPSKDSGIRVDLACSVDTVRHHRDVWSTESR